MIYLAVENGKIELKGYSDDATLAELRDSVETFRKQDGLITAGCAGCGLCCYYHTLPILGYDIHDLRTALDVTEEELFSRYVDLPDRPDIEERRAAIADMMRQHDLDRVTASLLYEYNTAEPVRFAKAEDKGCVFLDAGLCSIYESRAYTCALYVCNMAERFSIIQEQIVRLGVWHSYYVLGWIPAEEIDYNPFLKYSAYDEARLGDFDIDLEPALEKLFFYF